MAKSLSKKLSLQLSHSCIPYSTMRCEGSDGHARYIDAQMKTRDEDLQLLVSLNPQIGVKTHFLKVQQTQGPLRKRRRHTGRNTTTREICHDPAELHQSSEQHVYVTVTEGCFATVSAPSRLQLLLTDTQER